MIIFAVRSFKLNFATSQAIAPTEASGRKVRTAKSNAPVNSRRAMVCGNTNHGREKVPQKITTPTCRGKGENVR